MKKILALTSLVLLSACAETSTSSPTAVDGLVGKRLVADSGTVFLINADGTMGGEFRGEPIVGTYTASATEICSVLTAPAKIAGERCSVPVIANGTVVFNRRDGSKSAVYNIQ